MEQEPCINCPNAEYNWPATASLEGLSMEQYHCIIEGLCGDCPGDPL